MKLFRIVLILVNFCLQDVAYAALGDTEANISSDQAKLQATSNVRSQTSNLYITHELKGPMNTVIEYVDTKGKVFAVTWSGVLKPDLTILLGSYYKEYAAKEAARPKLKSRAPSKVQTNNVVVIRSGHMRDHRGRAYLPGSVPAGVTPEALQ